MNIRRNRRFCCVGRYDIVIELYDSSRVRLYGISTVQAVLYYQHSRKDGVLLKCVVSNLRTTWSPITPLNLNIERVSRSSAYGAVIHINPNLH